MLIHLSLPAQRLSLGAAGQGITCLGNFNLLLLSRE